MNLKGKQPQAKQIWCVGEMLIKLRARQEILGLNPMHAHILHENRVACYLPGFKFFWTKSTYRTG